VDVREIARIIEPHGPAVLLVSRTDIGIRQARAKTDRLDARSVTTSGRGRLEPAWNS
jgi:hypothetical protein